MGRYLGFSEKASILSDWEEKIRKGSPPGDKGGKGYPDLEIVPWCKKLNLIEDVCTIQSCKGHVTSGGCLTSGLLWIRLTERMSFAFDRQAFRLARMEGIERVERIYTDWGEEITSIKFQGAERNRLTQSMGSIFKFFSELQDRFRSDG